jgi:hypothetical protein
MGLTTKKTTEEFINLAKKMHSDMYDYSAVKYINNRTKVNILCNKHGMFSQLPKNHANGDGCPVCGREIASLKIKMSVSDFLEKAKKIHGNLYDYSKIKYINCITPIILNCNIHGDFLQKPAIHLQGKGCPICGKLLQGGKYTTAKFIEKAIKIHGNKFDYSKTIYKYCDKYVTIICKTHGEFEQIATSHLKKSGCPICNESKGEREIAKVLDLLNLQYSKDKTFKDCKRTNKLRFDFYLDNLNTCIEFDGEQHFVPIKAFGGNIALKYTQENDKIKNDFCFKENIPLLRIKYNENVEEKINLFLHGS